MSFEKNTVFLLVLQEEDEVDDHRGSFESLRKIRRRPSGNRQNICISTINYKSSLLEISSYFFFRKISARSLVRKTK